MGLLSKRAASLNALGEIMRVNGITPRSSSNSKPVTHDRAATIMAVWRCQHLLADITSGLTTHQFRLPPPGTKGVRSEVEPSPFITSPSNMMSAQEWKYSLVLSAAATGNGYAYITEWADQMMRFPAKAEVLSPVDVEVRRRGTFELPRYYVAKEEVDPARVLHLRAFGPAPGSVLGMDPIMYAANSVALALNSRDYGNLWYEGGGHPTAKLSTDEVLSAGDAEVVKQRFKTAVDDGLLVLGKSWDYEAMQVSPEQAAFLDASQATAVEVCGYYGIPPELLGYAPTGRTSVTYQNREQRAIDVLVFTIQWWLGRLETLLSGCVPNRNKVVIDADELLRADARTRWLVNTEKIRSGVASVNEIRAAENMEPIPEVEVNNDSGHQSGDRFLWPPFTVGFDSLDVQNEAMAGGGKDDDGQDDEEGRMSPEELSRRASEAAQQAAAAAVREAMSQGRVERAQPEVNVGPFEIRLPDNIQVEERIDVHVERAPTPVVNVQVPEQRAPDVHVDVAAPEVRAGDVIVNVPDQPAPEVQVDVHVPEPQPRDHRVVRDGQGRIAGIEEVD